MASIKSWISSFRLKTLPLSISGIIVGSSIAMSEKVGDIEIFIFALLTTLFLQILSNLANDYGDGVKGTDDNRIGSKRGVGSGEITSKQMLKAVVVFSFLSLISGIYLLWISFGVEYFLQSIIFLVIGVGAIAAAIFYTMGKNPYGYSGFGDLFVFIFFGLVSVVGTYFLYSKHLSWEVLLPATSVGLLSVGVLNINNLRDHFPDRKAGKKTLVVKLGVGNAKLYHEFIMIFAISLTIVYSSLNYYGVFQASFLVVIYPLITHVKRVVNNEDPKELEVELKTLALTTLAFSILFGLGLNLSAYF